MTQARIGAPRPGPKEGKRGETCDALAVEREVEDDVGEPVDGDPSADGATAARPKVGQVEEEVTNS